ncbi:MAG: sensor histidine kinase [Lachnospiraceae bacterium]|nr:sensor histidine kinase [Lachnospiraceae bacterium]
MRYNRWFMNGLLSKKKVRTQLYTVYVVAVFVPIVIVGIYLLNYVSDLLTTNYEESLRAEGIRIRTLFSELTSDVYDKTTDLMFDDEIKRILTTQEYPAEKVSNSVYYCPAINNLVYANVDIQDITIYTNNSYADNYLHFEAITEELEQETWMQRASDSYVGFWTTIESVNSKGMSDWNLCLVRRIAGIGKENKAVMVIQVKDSFLKGRISSKKYGIRILTENNVTCYSPVANEYGKSVDLVIDWENSYFHGAGTYWKDGKNLFYDVASLSMYQTNSRTFVVTTSDTAYYEIRRIVLTCSLILFAALVLPLLLILFFTGHFSNRVAVLRQEMKKVSNEEYDIIPEFHGRDELSEVFSDLQILVRNIKEKDARVYASQLRDEQLQNEQQKMEMKMLASQINPHFLYNTLESIRMQALTAGNREVANSIKLLGKSMRYVLENTGTGFITLQKELDYIETYIAIQKMRFGDRVNFDMKLEVDIPLEEYHILPFLVQPVIENAIVHGLEGITENGLIKMHFSLVRGYLQVSVTDNGIGMNEEELNHLRENINKNTLNASTSIGLGNIDRRIKLCYGEQYGLSVRSVKEKGTTVVIRLPLEKKEC